MCVGDSTLCFSLGEKTLIGVDAELVLHSA